MDVIFVMIDCLERDEWIVFSDFRQLDFEILKNSFIEYFLAVFCHNHHVIVTLIDTVRETDEYHSPYYT